MNAKKKEIENIKALFTSSQFPFKEISITLESLNIEIMKMDLIKKHPQLVRELEDKDLRGALYYSRDLHRFYILIHADGKKDIETGFDIPLNERERFTVVHEIGHYLKHELYQIPRKKLPEGVVFYRDQLASQGYDPDEMFANAFAAECLLPVGHVQRYLDSMAIDTIILPEDNSTMVAMAKRFGVNPAVVRNRLNSLGKLKEK